MTDDQRESQDRTQRKRLFKPGTMTADEAQRVLDRRCPAQSPEGDQCGDYLGHVPKKDHTLLVCTVFMHAEEVLRRCPLNR